MGHYHVPGGETAGGEPIGSCQTAVVVGVDLDADTVNLVVWTHSGEDEKHLDVPAGNGRTSDAASFHLSMECPYKR